VCVWCIRCTAYSAGSRYNDMMCISMRIMYVVLLYNNMYVREANEKGDST